MVAETQLGSRGRVWAAVKRRALTIVFAALALLAAAPAGPARAAARWFPPAQISGDSGAAPDVEFTSRGEAIAAWGGKMDDWEGPAQAGFRPPGGAFGPPQDLEPGGAPVLATRPNGAAAIVLAAGPPTWGWKVATRAPGERFSAPVAVPGTEPRDIRVAVDDDGTTTIAWNKVSYSDEPSLLQFTRLSPNGTFSEPRTIAVHKYINGPQLATGPDGSTTIMWDAWNPGETPDRSVVRVATAPRGGDFAAPVELSAPSFGGTQELLQSNARGDLMAVWQRRSFSSASLHPQEVWTAIKPAGGSWGPAERVPDPPHEDHTVLETTAAIGPAGEAVVGWSDGFRVVFSTRPADGHWRPAEPLTSYPVCCSGPPPGEQRDPTFAFDDAGNLHLVFTGQPQPHFKYGIWATHQDAGDDGFGTLELIKSVKDPGPPDVAVDPDGNAVAVWSERERPNDRDFGAERVFASIYDLAPPVVQDPQIGQYLDQSSDRRQALKFRLNEAARVTIDVSMRGRRIGTLRGTGLRGRNAIKAAGSLARLLSHRGSYRATIVARDAAGRRSKARAIRFTRLAR
jgi:hypothetical protein